MKHLRTRLALGCALALAASPALALEPLVAPQAAAPLAAPATPGDWVTMSGTVQSVGERNFILDIGADRIPVDMDGYARFNLSPGEAVTVTGRMQDPLTDHRLLNASEVDVPARNQRFYANPSDDGAGTYAYSTDPARSMTSTPNAPLTLTGTVVDASAPDAFTLSTPRGTFAVDGSAIAQTFKSRPVLIGDTVSVSGKLDTTNLFDRRQIDATSVTVIAPNHSL